MAPSMATAVTSLSTVSSESPSNNRQLFSTGPRSSPQSSVTKSQQKALPTTPQPLPVLRTQAGTWRHPKFDEIARRQHAGVFDSNNITRLAYNFMYLAATWVLPAMLSPYTPDAIPHLLKPYDTYLTAILVTIRLLFTVNLAFALKPLFVTADTIDDIALNPTQRALLGLEPRSTPFTPGETYITPPRYSRSVTPRSSASRRATQSPSGSPLTRRGRSGSLDRSLITSPGPATGSPRGASPWIQKALSGSTARRLSFDGYGANAELGASTSPGLGHGKASVGLNSRWLYEKGKGSPTGKLDYS